MLSRRGQRLVDFPAPAFLQVSRGRDTSSCVDFCVAENRVTKHLVHEGLQRTSGSTAPSALSYQDYSGHPPLRAAVAKLLAQHLGGCPDPDAISVMNGAGSVLVSLTLALTDPDDVVLCPLPLYYGFQRDFEAIPGARFVAVPGDVLSTDQLRSALEQCTAAGQRVRMLVLTNPGNPTGAVIPAAVLKSVVEWAAQHSVHVVFDEVYALSLFRSEPVAFASCLRLYPDGLPAHVHLVWGLSKDLCASGLRCAVLHTTNSDVRAAVARNAYFFQCAGPVQHQLAELLGDDRWVQRYVEAMRADLLRSAEAVEAHLTQHGVAFTQPQAAFFVWCDLTRWTELAGGEVPFLEKLRDSPAGGVLLCGGSDCNGGKSGWYRLCFTACPPEMLGTGLQRLTDSLQLIERNVL